MFNITNVTNISQELLDIKRPLKGSDSDLPWPYDPSQPIPSFDPNESPADMLKDWESFLTYLENGGGACPYNSALVHLRQILALANLEKEGKLTPEQEKQFKAILQTVNSDGTSIVSQLMTTAMYGAMYLNGASPEGMAKTLAFMTQLTNECKDFAGSSIPMFSQLLAAAAAVQADVTSFMSTNVLQGPKGPEFIDHGQVLSFSQFVQEQNGVLGDFFANSDIAQVIANYYSYMANDIVNNQAKGDPWKALVLLMSLLLGQDSDMGIQANAYGNTLSSLKAAIDKITSLLNSLKGGNFTPESAKDFMSQLTALKQTVDNDPSLAPLAPYLDQSINDILNTGGAAPSGGSYVVNPSQSGIFSVPTDLPAGTTVTYTAPDGSTHTLQPGQNYNIAAGGTIKITPPQGQTINIGDMGSNYTLDDGTTVQIFGDYGDLATSLNTIVAGQGMSALTTDLTSMETTVNGQSASVQQQFSTLTNTKTKFEGMIDEGFTSFKDVDTTIVRNEIAG